LPKDVKADVSDARLGVEALINMIFALVLAGCAVFASQVASCGFGYRAAGACVPFRAGGWISACWVLVLLAYGGARFAMEVLASKIGSLVDCYRLAALSQLGFALKTVGEELQVLQQLKGFFTQATPLKPSLAIAAVKSEAKADKADKDEAPEKSERKDNDDKDGKDNKSSNDENASAADPDIPPAEPKAPEGEGRPISA
jgi:hypothetical protein